MQPISLCSLSTLLNSSNYIIGPSPIKTEGLLCYESRILLEAHPFVPHLPSCHAELDFSRLCDSPGASIPSNDFESSLRVIDKHSAVAAFINSAFQLQMSINKSDPYYNVLRIPHLTTCILGKCQESAAIR